MHPHASVGSYPQHPRRPGPRRRRRRGHRPVRPGGREACEQYVAQHSPKATDGAVEACYQGQIGNRTSCVSSLVAVGASKDDANSACEASR
ncbi:hypothetical protein [Streptomyces virginiae]|uniref:hypothetical protein n=1 Tax=Streptomyces virginiae TaxID=1961 RepID=UPI0034526FAC